MCALAFRALPSAQAIPAIIRTAGALPFEDKGLRHFVDHERAIDSQIAKLIREYPIKSQNVIAHIRKATQGVVSLQNCHPFVRELWGRNWCLRITAI